MLEKVKRRSLQNLLRAHQLSSQPVRWILRAALFGGGRARRRAAQSSQTSVPETTGREPMRRAEMQPHIRILREISNTVRKERQLALSSDESPPNALKHKRRLPRRGCAGKGCRRRPERSRSSGRPTKRTRSFCFTKPGQFEGPAKCAGLRIAR